MSWWSRRMPRAVDAAAAVVVTAAGEAEVWLEPLGGPTDRPLLAASYLAILGVAWHRRAPVAALAVVMVGAVVVPSALHVDPAAGLAWMVAVLGVIASAGYHARRPWVPLVLALGLFLLAIILQKGFSPSDVVFAWLLGGAAWVAGRAIGTRTLRAQLSEQRAVMAEREAQVRAESAVAEERLRIARELHDVVSHGISVMTLHVGGVRRLLRPDQVQERALLEAVERTGRESLAEMQRMLGVLRTPEPHGGAPAPGLESLPGLLEPLEAAGIRTSLTVTGTVRPLAPGPGLAAHRIVQEALTNVLKHAGASQVECVVHYGPSAVELTVADDGSSAPAGGAGGHGQAGMRERAALYGGSVEAGPRPGGGYAVSAVLPVGAAVPEPARQDAP